MFGIIINVEILGNVKIIMVHHIKNVKHLIIYAQLTIIRNAKKLLYATNIKNKFNVY